MQISELIAHLQEMYDRHGDIQVGIQREGYDRADVAVWYTPDTKQATIRKADTLFDKI